jgi:acyl-CoA dehydrogenase
MTDEARLIGEAARGILTGPIDADRPWEPILNGGWIGVGVDEADGGLGGSLVEAAAIATAAGYTAAPAPVVEAVLAAIVLASCTPVRAILPRLIAGNERASLVGEVVRSDLSACVAEPELVVPWGRDATLVVLIAALAEGGLGLLALPLAGMEVVRDQTLAGDPLDRVRLTSALLPAEMHELDVPVARLLDAAAILSAARLCGALRRVAELTLEYARQRSQFGRPIGSFQAVAHALAQQEAQVALAEAALAGALAGAASAGIDGRAEAARVAAGAAVDPVVKVAHQVHGAIGVTREHDLHRFTLRLIEWRGSFGSATWWSGRLGRRVIAAECWRDAVAPLG